MIGAGPPNTGRRCAIAGAGAVLAIATGLSGCSQQPSDSSGGGTMSPTPTPTATGRAPGKGVPRGLSRSQSRVNRADANSVAKGFIARLNLWDTRIDESPHGALIRAIPYAAPRLASQLATQDSPGAESKRWQQLKAHDGWTTVVTVLPGSRPESNKHATRTVVATVTDHGTDHWTHRHDSATYTVELTRVGARANWLVQAYNPG